MAPPATISSEKLEKILEVNAKAIEINTIVSVQYEKIIDHLEKMKTLNDVRDQDLDDILEVVKDQHKAIIAGNQEIKKSTEELLSITKNVKDIVDKMERMLYKASVIFVTSSAVISTVFQIVAKVYFKI